MPESKLPMGLTGVVLIGLSWVTTADAAQYLLGPADSLAIDQPRITFGLLDETTLPSPTLIGPEVFNSALLDTGANGVLLAAPSYNQGEDYGQPIFDGSPATYAELGVAGTSLLDVHEPWSLRIQDSDGVERIVRSDVRAFGDSSLNIGSFGAIVGMPAMEGFVVEVDMRPTAQLEFQRVLFHDAIEEAAFESAASIHVDLRILAPEHTDTTLPQALRPTFAGLPLIDNVDLTHRGGANSGGATRIANDYTFLVDTGAQTMIISEQMADDLGIDYLNGVGLGGDVVDSLEVGGIGGMVAMPLVTIDRFVMPLQGGDQAVLTDLVAGVLNIDGAPFDAVLGMNLFTSGYLSAIFGGGTSTGLVDDDVPDVDSFQLLVDFGFVTTIDDLFVDLPLQGPVLNISRDEYDLLVESQILPDTDDPIEAVEAALALDDELDIGDIVADGPVFDKVVFDFTADDQTALLRLDLAQALSVAGDLDGDAIVDITDLGNAIDHFTGANGSTTMAYTDGDMDGDGDVDNADLGFLIGEFSDPQAALAAFAQLQSLTVPEPSSTMLLGIGGLWLASRRRR